MIEKLLTVVLLLALSGCGVSRPPAADPLPVAAPSPRIESEPVDILRLFEPHEYRSHGQVLPYRLFAPRREASMKKYPLVVFLHGASSSGKDNRRQLTGSGYWGASPWLSEEVQRAHPSFILAPQANPARGEAWVRRWRKPEGQPAAEPEPLDLVIELVDRLVKELPIDPSRLYITGLSMGGFGTWSAITRYPGKFAAAVPVCGGGDPSTVVRNQTAVWAFHGAGDLLVSPQRSREMVEAFRDAGAEAKYTEYPDLDHNSWERAYQEPDLARWLFSQRRRESSASE
jgi:predicted peptidase